MPDRSPRAHPGQLARVRLPPHRPGGTRDHDRRQPVFARFESGRNPSDPVDRAIFATRSAVFPEHGLMPEP